MAVDLLVRTPPPRRAEGHRHAASGSRIVAIEPGTAARRAASSTPAGASSRRPRRLPFPWTRRSLGLPRSTARAPSLEGIASGGELKPLTLEAVIDRALRYCDLAVAQGLLAIRTHVDVCDDRSPSALLEVKRRRPHDRPPAVAFPQTATTARRPRRPPDRALDRGVDVVGGIPHLSAP